MQLYKFRQIHEWLLFGLLSAIKSIGSTFHDKVKLPVFCSSSVAVLSVLMKEVSPQLYM